MSAPRIPDPEPVGLFVRRPDWRGRLDAYVDGVRRKPFEWGCTDCGRFCAGALHAMTGVDALPGWARVYASRKGALRALRRAGYDRLSDVAARLLREIRPAEARVGDVAAIATGDEFGDALGIVNGERILVVTEYGIDSHDRSEAVRAFRVGR